MGGKHVLSFVRSCSSLYCCFCSLNSSLASILFLMLSACLAALFSWLPRALFLTFDERLL